MHDCAIFQSEWMFFLVDGLCYISSVKHWNFFESPLTLLVSKCPTACCIHIKRPAHLSLRSNYFLNVKRPPHSMKTQ